MHAHAESIEGTKHLTAVPPNSEAALVLEKELSVRREEANAHAEFHSREARIYRAVEDACGAALESLNRPQDTAGPSPSRY